MVSVRPPNMSERLQPAPVQEDSGIQRRQVAPRNKAGSGANLAERHRSPLRDRHQIRFEQDVHSLNALCQFQWLILSEGDSPRMHGGLLTRSLAGWRAPVRPHRRNSEYVVIRRRRSRSAAPNWGMHSESLGSLVRPADISPYEVAGPISRQLCSGFASCCCSAFSSNHAVVPRSSVSSPRSRSRIARSSAVAE